MYGNKSFSDRITLKTGRNNDVDASLLICGTEIIISIESTFFSAWVLSSALTLRVCIRQV